MNGAESLIRTLVAGGIQACFTNPGTSEINIVAALDQATDMRCVLGLFEGVVTGAADGYARMARKPACTLLHLGPGFGNGIANLHNASRAQVPIVNIVGQHAIYHLRHDTPLTSDIEAIARPYSRWLRTSCAASELGRDAAEAIVAAAPGRIATLIVPADVAWGEGGVISEVPALPKASPPKIANVERAAAMSLDGMQPIAANAERPSLPTGDINLQGLAAAIGALLPENTIVVDESMTSGRGLMAATRGAPPHDWLANTGGSIGIALPLAVGAAVACPKRDVLCLTADGSAMYTAQALWTMVREGLNVTTVVFANRAYAVLKREFSYLGVGNPGPHASDMFEIGRPDLDWVLLAKGMGVPGTRVTSREDFARALREGFEGGGPMLIEVRL